jgi:hypothetical protein
MLSRIAPLTRLENENDMGFKAKMDDLLYWVRFKGKMYDTCDPSTLAEIRDMKLLSLSNVILYKLQAKGPLDVKARISAENVSGN